MSVQKAISLKSSSSDHESDTSSTFNCGFTCYLSHTMWHVICHILLVTCNKLYIYQVSTEKIVFE